MKNLAASISAKLKNESKATGRAFNLVLEDYATARLFARLSTSKYAQSFILKGAQLFKLWADTPHRPTRDADFLSFGNAAPDQLKANFEEICRIETDPPDALEWTVEKVAPIREDNHYGGVRLQLSARLANIRIPAQIDVGFGDAITPEAQHANWPMPLDFPEVELLVYRPETAIAEKLHAAVVLEATNSRMKDFFDLHWLCTNQSFSAELLQKAIQATFERRNTKLPTTPPLALTDAFASRSEKQTQWKAFLRKSRLQPLDLNQVIAQVATFLLPVLGSKVANQTWHPQTGWKPSNSS